jgi:hypothetical protein
VLRICTLEYLLTSRLVSLAVIEGSCEMRTCESGSMAASGPSCSSVYAVRAVAM